MARSTKPDLPRAAARPTKGKMAAVKRPTTKPGRLRSKPPAAAATKPPPARRRPLVEVVTADLSKDPRRDDD